MVKKYKGVWSMVKESIPKEGQDIKIQSKHMVISIVYGNNYFN